MHDHLFGTKRISQQTQRKQFDEGCIHLQPLNEQTVHSYVHRHFDIGSFSPLYIIIVDFNSNSKDVIEVQACINCLIRASFIYIAPYVQKLKNNWTTV